MISTHWLDERTRYWKRLEALVDRTAEAGLASLNRTELQELGLLYRQTATDLAVLAEDPGSVRYVEYVNQLVARSHHTIYSAERPRVRSAVRLVSDYSSTVRSNLPACAVALLLFLASGIVGASVTYRDRDFSRRFLGPQMTETINRREMWTHSIVGFKPVASSRIMTNNMSVALTTFAMGVTAGAGTIYMLVFNGLLLGVIGMACARAGMSLALWSFVAPHGVLELPAIVLAGGAGLRLAQGMLFPGVLPRRQSLTAAGGQAIKLVLGSLPILVVAGTIEAFVSPTDMAVRSKFVMAAALFVLLLAYLFHSARTPLTSGSAA